ncbi:putative cruciform DNA binding protein [Tribonema minus]|uniref:Putative cruciform DNA binding protein n=1 Tax=Tribonema minus TaxID=303371 RepID=A0A835YPK6_9STRA|nr:putative cruciform DNA binding protein [Tribonema minus]
MSSSGPSKVTGTKDEILGSAKATIGSTIGNHQMEAEGHTQNKAGTAEKSAAAAKQKVDGAGDSLFGHAQKATGQVLGNERMQGEGEMNKAKGTAKSDTA